MLTKLLSGRWILTVICGVVFVYCAINKLLPKEAVISIITMVFVAYFDRNDRNGQAQK